MKRIFCILFLSCGIMFVKAQKAKVDSNFHVYLLIGQSNMAGRGKVDEESKKEDQWILMLNKENKWVAATDPVHFDKPESVGVGPAISFAKEMLGANKKVKIGIIPCAWGGSSIKVWQPGAEYFKVNHPYDEAIGRTKIAMQQGVLKGILWHQGESDNDSAHASIYLNKLQVLVNSLRTDLQQPKVPFVAGEIGYFNKTDFINKVIHQLPQKVSNTAVVSAKELTDNGDRLHFDTPSARELGRRYAAEMKRLQGSKEGHKSVKNK